VSKENELLVSSLLLPVEGLENIRFSVSFFGGQTFSSRLSSSFSIKKEKIFGFWN